MVNTTSSCSSFSDGTYYFDGLPPGNDTVSVDPT